MLGRLLRQVHDRPALATSDCPPNTRGGGSASASSRRASARTSGPFLMQVFDELLATIGGLDFPLPEAVNHGDAYLQNLMIIQRSRRADRLRGLSWGRPEWDLAMTATE